VWFLFGANCNTAPILVVWCMLLFLLSQDFTDSLRW
jgi:hypothetical protein